MAKNTINQTQLKNNSGWQLFSSIPTYVSSNAVQFTDGIIDGKISAGMKIKFVQNSTVKYFTVTTITDLGESGDILVVSPRNSEVVDNTTITNVYISTEAQPLSWGYKESDIYSTSERDTGSKWINGKPIYSRTFTGTVSYSSNVRFSGTLLASAGIDTLIRTEGTWVSGTNKIPLGSVFPTASGQLINISMMVYVSSSDLAYVGTTGDSGSGAYYAVVYYTKL